MATITLTNDDGSTVQFLDPNGVQAAITAAIAAIPATPTVEVTDAGITVTHTDGSSQDFVPAQSSGPATAPVETVPVEAAPVTPAS